MKKLTIGFFDSGVGGLSILRHAPTFINNAEYLYVADSQYAPYGEKTVEFVRERSLWIADFLVTKKVDAIVVACNTATAIAIDAIRERHSIPIIGIEPAIKPTIALTKNKKIAVLGTKNTFLSQRYKNLKQQHAIGMEVSELALHHWVNAVENGLEKQSTINSMVKKDIQPLLDKGVDTFILGCTHFPFLKEILMDITDGRISILDPAEAVIEQLLNKLNIEKSVQASNSKIVKLYSSASKKDIKEKVKGLIAWQATTVEKI